MTSANRREILALALLLAVCGLLIYAPVAGHEFVNYDDPDYVVDNPHVNAGLTWGGVVWAFTAQHSGNWHPLTWLSHMLDCEVFGLDPGAQHLVSVALHVGAAVLLLLALVSLTGDVWPSAFVAAMFTVHPLRVESVAWIAERKDVLSGLFWMAALLAYARYVRRPTVRAYLVVAICFGLGLMAKPMLVTLPVVLLLLDVWPLGRFTERRVLADGISRLGLLVEKLPLFLMSAASGIMTLGAQRGGGAVESLELIAPGWRLANAASSYVAYVWKSLWPTGLAVFYPHPIWQPSRSPGAILFPALAAGVVLLAVTSLTLVLARRRPWLACGWLWFLVTLLPVIGLVQVGSQAMADRYAYLPTIGLYMAVAWEVRRIPGRGRARNSALAVLAIGAILAAGFVARRQVTYWHDSRALFERALAVTDDNFVAHNNLGTLAETAGNLDEAAEHYERAVLLRPDYGIYLNNLGTVKARQGALDAAASLFDRAVGLNPHDAVSLSNLGSLRLVRGQVDGAIELLQRAVRLDPGNPRLRGNLGAAYEARGDLEPARVELERALKLRPDYVAARLNLGHVAARSGRDAEAVAHYRRVLELEPRALQASLRLAWLLATSADESVRDGAEALELSRRCLELLGPDVERLELAAAAHAELGGFEEAVRHQHEAIELAGSGGESLRGQLEDYQARRPRRERPSRRVGRIPG